MITYNKFKQKFRGEYALIIAEDKNGGYLPVSTRVDYLDDRLAILDKWGHNVVAVYEGISCRVANDMMGRIRAVNSGEISLDDLLKEFKRFT
jgi:hypothetical protein